MIEIASTLASLLLPALPAAYAPRQEKDLVAVELVSELDAVRPGERFVVALRLRMEPGWHIYWENPGDSGMPTLAEIAAPEGFTVGAPLYPGPETFEMPGDLLSYGYEGETMLLFQVEAPTKLPEGGKLTFEAKASWLVCKELCFVGEGRARLSLAVAQGDAAPQRRPERLEPHRSRLPRPLAERTGASARWEGDPDAPILRIELPGAAAPDYFPAAEQRGLELDAELLEELAGGGTTIVRRYSFVPRVEGALPRARGVIGVGAGDERRYFELELAWPAAEPSPDQEGDTR